MLKNPNSRLGDGYSDALDDARVREIRELSLNFMESGGRGPDGTYSDLECYIWEQFNLMYALGRKQGMTGG